VPAGRSRFQKNLSAKTLRHGEREASLREKCVKIQGKLDDLKGKLIQKYKFSKEQINASIFGGAIPQVRSKSMEKDHRNPSGRKVNLGALTERLY